MCNNSRQLAAPTPGIVAVAFDASVATAKTATSVLVNAVVVAGTAVVVIVAQRVSTIRDADQILVLEDGECVGLGTHDELLATCPTFQEIVESQAAVNEGVA
jgi:ATP-binding cassette subfamily B protein